MPRRRKDSLEGPTRVREKPIQRNAANARERARMRILSRAFSRLKTTLPWVPPDTKLSKLDTLRLATSYISHLRGLLQEEGSATQRGLPPHPRSMAWPFSLQKTPEGGTMSSGSHQCQEYSHYDQTATQQMHNKHQPQVDRYFSEDLLPEYDYYPGDQLVHIA